MVTVFLVRANLIFSAWEVERCLKSPCCMRPFPLWFFQDKTWASPRVLNAKLHVVIDCFRINRPVPGPVSPWSFTKALFCAASWLWTFALPHPPIWKFLPWSRRTQTDSLEPHSVKSHIKPHVPLSCGRRALCPRKESWLIHLAKPQLNHFGSHTI